MHCTESHNIPGLVLVDFEKVFDFVSWSFIKKNIGYFKF